jgi:signal transduction histidine kinase/DNA-binding response OmpR family regulator
MDANRVLVVDDEESIRHVVHGVLSEAGCVVQLADSAEHALDLIREQLPDSALVDIVLPGMDGIELLKRIKRASPDTEVVMMTSHASLSTATAAIKEGAYDYLEKPFDEIEEVWRTIERALDKRRLAVGNRALLEEQERRNQHLSAAVARLSSLIEAGCAMGGLPSLPEILDFFVGLVTKELDVERASLMILDPIDETLSIAAWRGITEIDPRSVRLRLGEGVSGRVAQNGKAVLVEDATRSDLTGQPCKPTLSDSFISAPIVLSIPIKAGKHVLGVINVTNRRSKRPFGEGDLEYLAGLAGQLAVAIERARHLETMLAAQKQLVASERMKALGQMAAGVAHDFNNTLGAILTRAEFALTRLDADSPDLEAVRSDLESIRKVSLQGASTIKRIQEYTRIRKDVPTAAVDLNQVVQEAIEMTRPKWKDECEAKGTRIELRIEAGKIPKVAGDFHALTQVVDNLIFNAVEAMPRGGTLSFRTWAEADSVHLEVADTGIGMDDQCRRRLFEPFFTTKETGQGLGTSIAYGIVSRHHGEILVDSAPGQGTTFHVRLLPARSEDAQPVMAVPRATKGPRTGRILVVEDDPMLREAFEEVLSSGGHKVVAASNGNQAIGLLARQEFDLVITDLGMPGVSGLDLARAVKRSDADLPVVLLTGWAVQQGEPKIREAGVDYVLVKPCPNKTLLDTVQLALHGCIEA